MPTNAFNQSPYDTLASDMEAEAARAAILPGQQPNVSPLDAPDLTKVDTPDTAAILPPTVPASDSPKPKGALPPDALTPVFVGAAKKYNVPVNVLMAMAHQESGYDPKAVGQPTKYGQAKGMLQYLDSTAKGMGIDSLDAAQSIDAAAKQIRARLDKGSSMKDAIKEHFAGPDRSQWGEKTDAYGKEVMGKVREIGQLLTASAPVPDKAPAREPEKQNRFSSAMPRSEYYANFVALNPGATPDAIQAVMAQYDKDASTRTNVAGNKVQDKFRAMQSPEAIFTEKLNAKLQGKQDGVIPALPGRGDNPDAKMPAAALGALDQAGADLKRGANNLKSLGVGAAAVATDALGLDATTDKLLATYVQMANDNARDNPAAIGSYKKIKSLGDAGKYAVEAVLENAAMIIPSVVSGGVGAAAARKGAEALVAGMIEKQIAGGVTRQIAEANAAKFIMTRVTQGSLAGVAPATVGMEAGSMMGDNFKETGQKRSGVALAYGIPAGLLDTIEPVMALRKIAGPVVDEVAGHILKRFGLEVGKQFLTEAGTEGLQTVLEQASTRQIDGKRLLNPALLDDVIDSALKGGIGGGVMGGASQGVHEVQAAANSPARQVAREIDSQVQNVNFVGHDGAARAAMDPNNEAIDPAQTRKPAVTSPPAPLTDAVKGAAEQRVTVTAPQGQVEATLQAYQPTESGGFAAQVRGDDGQIYTISDADGVQLAPAQDSGPLSSALSEAAGRHAAEQSIEPVAAPAAPKALADMSDAELAERRAYILGVAKQNGASKMTVEARTAVEREMSKRAKAAANATPPENHDDALPARIGDAGGSNPAAARTGAADNGRHEGAGPVSGVGPADAAGPVGKDRPDPVRTDPATDAQPALKGEPPIAKGMTRLYHGGDTGRYDGKAWFSTDRKYAEGYAKKDNRKGAEVQYVDYPTAKIDAYADPDGYGQTPAKGFHTSLELSSDETGLRNPLTQPEKGAKADWQKNADRKEAKLAEQLRVANENAAKKAAAKVIAKAAAESPVAQVAGDKIDKEWTAFAKDSGTLNIDRADMPQVKAEHRGALVNFLNARGIKHEQYDEVPAGSLKPTQREFSPAKVDKAKAYEGGDRAILVSHDNHVLDGHHQWLAKLDANEPVKIIKLYANIEKLLAEVRQFPSAEATDGAASSASTAGEPQAITKGNHDAKENHVPADKLAAAVADAPGSAAEGQDRGAGTAAATAADPTAVTSKAAAGDVQETPPTVEKANSVLDGNDSTVIPSGNEIHTATVEPVQDTGADIPKAFHKKVKVPHDVWIADENQYETVEIAADQALKSVREDIHSLRSLLDCMKG